MFFRIVFLKHIDTSGFAKVVPSKVWQVESERNLGKIYGIHGTRGIREKGTFEEIAESLEY